MSIDEQRQSTLWADIDALLTQARDARPLHRAESLLDLDRLIGCAAPSLPARLARAMEGWEDRLLLGAIDDGLAPDVRIGDRLVIDTDIEASDGDIVVVFTAGALFVRRLRLRDGQHWLESGKTTPSQLSPQVAILGVVVEVRRSPRR